LITLILGGARSGKSRYAEALASQANRKVVFLATGHACDEEMRAKIDRHRRERPSEWRTVETPLDLDAAIVSHGTHDAFLIVDCLTTLSSNLLLAEAATQNDWVLACVERICEALADTPASVAVVSNEVGNGVVPEYQMGRAFRDLLGEFNQKVARIADNVILMVAGCPLALKGKIQVQAEELHGGVTHVTSVPR